MAYGDFVNINSAINAWNNTYNQMRNLVGNFQQSASNYLSSARESQAMSNAFNASEAVKQRKFNAEQAAIDRKFQQEMSSTAHQREVQDLVAAGLSPVLAANGGASTPSGAMATSSAASTSDNLTSVFGSIANSAVNAVSNLSQTLNSNATQVLGNTQAAQIQKYATELTNETNWNINEANRELNKYVADLQSWTSQEVAHIAGRYGLEQAQIHALANQYAAELAYDASRIQSELGYKANERTVDAAIRNTNLNNLTSWNVAKANNVTSTLNTTIGVAGDVIGNIVGTMVKKKLGLKV